MRFFAAFAAGVVPLNGQASGPITPRPEKPPSPAFNGATVGQPHLVRSSEQPDESVIRVDVELVNIFFTVQRQRSGELVANLNENDFEVFEDGEPQKIARFSKESNLPLELGLLIDVSRSQANLIENEREAGSAFLSGVIRPTDEAFLLSFGHETDLVQDFTNSVSRLRSALNALHVDSGPTGGVPPRQNGGGFPFPGGGVGRYPGGGGRRSGGGSGGRFNGKGTLLFDAVYLACTDEIDRKPGRKALILVTDGGDRGSYYRRDQAVEAAQRADTIVYSVYYVDRKAMGGRFGGNRSANTDDDLENLNRMAGETGGRVFKVSNDHTLEDIFAQIQAEMRSQYSIGYKSTNPNRDGAFRSVEIRAKSPGYEVHGRKGYYATQRLP